MPQVFIIIKILILNHSVIEKTIFLSYNTLFLSILLSTLYTNFFSSLDFYQNWKLKTHNFHCELVRKHNREKKAFSAGLVQPLTADFACSVVSAMPARQIIHMALTAHYGRFCQKNLKTLLCFAFKPS